MTKLLNLRLLPALALLLAAAAAWFVLQPVQAQVGVPLPAPFGTTWSVVAGYNTGTHGDHDGGDPHALDITRVDASPDWTPVLAPVGGTVTWYDNNCLIIEDAPGYAHLLCHLDPADRVQRGLEVAVGDLLGLVFPAGLDANGGIAHIHYAIHQTSGSGWLNRTIPFSGSYALEGVDLPWRDEYNLHSGTEFTSTNGPGWTAPAPSAPSAPSAPPVEAPAAESSEAAAAAVDEEPVHTHPHPHAGGEEGDEATEIITGGGWQLVGVTRTTSVANFFQTQLSNAAPLTRIAVHNPYSGAYGIYDPTIRSRANGITASRTLFPGQAVWAQVERGTAWYPSSPSKAEGAQLQLQPGPNLISWQGNTKPTSEALANVPNFRYAYTYHPASGQWHLYHPTAPSTLTTLITGQALYVVVGAPTTWTQRP